MAFKFCPEIAFLRQNNEEDYMALIETEFDNEKNNYWFYKKEK